jgi:hypothetical protein
MADYFTHHTAKEYVPCSEAQFAKLEELLALAPPADEPAHGFEIEWANGSVYLFAETNGCTGSLPKRFLQYLGKLIHAAGLPYLEVSFACTCTKMRPVSHGGGAYRIMPNGEIVFENRSWLEPTETQRVPQKI